MSNVFTVLLDLSDVKSDKKENQQCVVLVDTSIMKFIYEFKHWINFLCSLEYPIEFFQDNAALHDLDDIRILSLLNVVQVKRAKDLGREEDKVKLWGSKSVQSTEDHGSKSHKLMSGEIDSNDSFTDADRDDLSKIQMDTDRSGKSQKVSGYCSSKKIESLTIMPLKTNENYTEFKKPNNGLGSNIFNKQQHRKLELQNKIDMRENLKKAFLMQQKYYRWHGESDGHASQDQYMNHRNSNKKNCNINNHLKRETFENLNFRAQHTPFQCSAKLMGNVRNDIKSRYICDDSQKCDKKVIHKEPISNSELSNPANHLCKEKIFCSDGFNNKSSASLLAVDAGVKNLEHTTGVTKKPLSGTIGEINITDSDNELNILSKSLSVDDAIKLLRKTAALRSKQLSFNDIDNRVEKMKEVKKSQSETVEPDKDTKCKENLFKHKISKETQDMPAKKGKVNSSQNSSRNTGARSASFQPCPMPRKSESKSKINIAPTTGNRVQDNVTANNCGKRGKNHMAKAQGSLESESKPGTSGLIILGNSRKKNVKNKSKINITPTTGNRAQDNVTANNCGKRGKNHMAKAQGSLESESKPGTSGLIIMGNSRKKNIKNKSKINITPTTGNRAQDNVTANNCGKRGKNHMAKAQGSLESESKPGTSGLIILGNSRKKNIKNKSKINITPTTGNRAQDNVTANNCGKPDKIHMPKAQSSLETESGTRVAYSLLQNHPPTTKKITENSNSNLRVPNNSNFILKEHDKLVPPNFETKQVKTVDQAINRIMEKLDLNNPCASGSIVNQITRTNHNIDSMDIKKSKEMTDVAVACTEKNFRIAGDNAVRADKRENKEFINSTPEKISRHNETHEILFTDINKNGNELMPSFSKASKEESITQSAGRNDNKKNYLTVTGFSDSGRNEVIALPYRNLHCSSVIETEHMAAVEVPKGEISKIRKNEPELSNKYKHSEYVDRVPEDKLCYIQINDARFSRVLQEENRSLPSSCTESKQGKDNCPNSREKGCELSSPAEFNVSFGRVANQAASCIHLSANNKKTGETKDLRKDEYPIAVTVNDVNTEINEDTHAAPFGEGLTSEYQSNMPEDRKTERHGNGVKNVPVRFDAVLESLKVCWITVVIFIYLIFLKYLF